MVIDINPNPDISHEGGIKLPIKALGMDYVAFIDLILSSVKERILKVSCHEKIWSETIKAINDADIQEQTCLDNNALIEMKTMSEINV